MTSNKFIRGPLWATLVAALVTAMVAAFFVLVQSGEAAQVADEQPYEPKIIGGTAVPTGKYPFIAALIDTRIQGNTPLDQQFCGGTLIDENSVLTAGHCVDDDREAPGVQLSPTAPLRVTVGRTVLNSSNQGQVRNVKRIFPHPNYRGHFTSWNYDAAVLELSHPVSGIQPIKLATSSQNYLERPGLNATVAGWGSTTARPACKPSNVPPAYPNRMREAQVPIVSDARAEQIYQDICPASGVRSQYTPPLMVAAGGTGKDTCQGDSGGPLFVAAAPDAAAPDTQIGITSFGPGCGPKGYPGAYTEVNASPIASFIKRAAS